MHANWQTDVQRDLTAWTGIAFATNVGIATGAPSGFWVLDYDPAGVKPTVDGQPTAVDRVHHLIHDDDLAPHVTTGGGGWHWRFELPADFEVTNRRGTLPAGLDARGTGGQVVAPPSVSGKGAYVELTGAAPYVAPAWLLDMIRPAVAPTTRLPPVEWSPPTDGDSDRGPRYARAAVGEILTELRLAESNRNDLAFRAACRILELANAGWLNPNSAFLEWLSATEAHPLGIVVPTSEINSIWHSATRTVGSKRAVLDEFDPTGPAPLGPPLPPLEPPPFPVSGNGAVTLSVADRPTLAPPVSSTGMPTPDAGGSTGAPSDVSWEGYVAHEVLRIRIRKEAQRRAAELEVGDLAARVASLRAELLTPAAMRARPRLQPLVAGLLYRNTLARINGASGCGKSFVTLDLAARVAGGMPWAGRATHAGRVVYLVAEGDEGVGGRLDAWEAQHEPIGDVLFMPRPVQASGPEWAAWVALLADLAPALVVVDTQARVSVGTDENDAREMGELVHALDALRAATGACVLLVHHTGRTGQHGRGSTAVTGALQTELTASRSDRQILVKGAKSKDDAAPEDMMFELVDVVGPLACKIGVVPLWSGDMPVAIEDDPAVEPAHRRRARGLYREIRRVYATEGGTRADIMSLFYDRVVPDLSRSTGTGRDAWRLAWRELIELGLIAKAIGEARFTVVVGDQSVDGVLTSNRTPDGLPVVEPDGYEVRGVQDQCYRK